MKSDFGVRLLGVFISILIFQSACGRDPRPEVLFAPPGASGVEYSTVGGSEQIRFGYTERHPAVNLIETLNTEIEGLGWTQRDLSYLNPDLPTSHVRGWTQFSDVSGDEELSVHQWMGEWENASGDVVVYVFQYSYPRNGDADLDNLTGTGWVDSREEIEEQNRLRPQIDDEIDRERRTAERRTNLRAEQIREKSAQTGFITVKVVGKRSRVPIEGTNGSEWQEVIEYVDEVPPLKLEIVGATATGSQLEIVFSKDSAAVLRVFSRDHANRLIAVFIDDELIWMPMLQGEIGDIAVFDGNFTPEEAQVLAERIMQ